MKIFYGVINKSIDVTQICIERLKNNNINYIISKSFRKMPDLLTVIYDRIKLLLINPRIHFSEH